MNKNNIVKFQKPKPKNTKSKKGYALYNEGLCFYRQDKDSLAMKKFLQAEEAGYESSDMFSTMARLYGAESQFDKVKEYAQKAIDIDSEYGFPYYMLGGAYYECSDYETALKYYLIAEEKGYDDDIIMFREIAELYGRVDGNNFLKQLEYATKAIALNPDNAFSRYWKGWMYFRHQDYSHALKYYLKSEDMGYSDFSLYYEISYCYSMLGHLKKAIEYANKCIFMNKEDAMGYYRKGFAYFMEDDLKKSEQNLLMAEQKSCDESDMYSRLAFIYQTRNDFDNAIKYAQKSIEKDKTDIDGYAVMGNIYVSLKKDYRTALKYYKKAYSVKVDYTEDFYANFAVLYVMLNRYKLANKLLDEAFKKFPKSYNLMSIKIGILQFKKDYDNAEKLTKKLVKIEPENIWNLYYKALVYYNCKKDRKDYKKVIKILEKVNDENVITNGGTYAVLSFSYCELKNYEMSLEYLYKFFQGNSCEEFFQKNYKEINRYIKKLAKKLPNDFRIKFILQKFPKDK